MLRVIGGLYKSRKIKEVKSDLTRPTTDRNKEALFNILGQYFDGGKLLDLFSGSGSIGIEALSRGFDQVDFVEKSIPAYKTIEENLKTLNITTGASVFKQDVFTFLNTTNRKDGIIFADPPYALNKYDELLDVIVSRQLLCNDGIIIFEADNKTELVNSLQNVYKYREKVLGNTKFGFYKVEEQQWK